jgi:hypothetical protein
VTLVIVELAMVEECEVLPHLERGLHSKRGDILRLDWQKCCRPGLIRAFREFRKGEKAPAQSPFRSNRDAALEPDGPLGGGRKRCVGGLRQTVQGGLRAGKCG